MRCVAYPSSSRVGERMQEKMNRLRWQCRRGMLELDLLLLPFFDKYYLGLSGVHQALFEQLLTYQDPELYQMLIKHQPVDPDLYQMPIKDQPVSDSNLRLLIESILRGH